MIKTIHFGALTDMNFQGTSRTGTRRQTPRWTLWVAGLLCAATVQAQVSAPAPVPTAAPAPQQFDISGLIQSATLDTAGALCAAADPRLAGGLLKVNGVEVVIPCNTVLQLPATSMTWADLFRFAPAGTPAGQSGLALTDTLPVKAPYNAALPSFNVRVVGNQVGGRHIAGLVFIEQNPAELGTPGVVSYINYATGEIHLNGTPNVPAPGDTRIRLNDPVGRFGKRHGAPGSGADVIAADFDARFTADTDNPTVRSQTGYPMCVPRIDPYNRASGGEDPACPIRNRPLGPDCRSLPAGQFPAFPAAPAGQYCRTFAMEAPPVAAGPGLAPCVNGVCATDPTRQAPIVVGDTVTYKGALRYDPVTGPYMSVHELVANVGIYTQPGVKPAYVAIDMMLLGLLAQPVAGLAQEAKPEMRFEGVTTDPSMFVDLYTVDQDPMSGVEVDRHQGAASPTATGVLGRFRYRVNGFLGTPTRTMRAVSRNLCGDDAAPCALPANLPTHANGLVAGTYQAPVFEFVFPENTLVGAPVVPANLQDLPFLFCGSGPLRSPSVPAGVSGPVVGQLAPAPWALPMPNPAIASAMCPAAPAVGAVPAAVTPGTSPAPVVGAPRANAGLAQTVAAGATVGLSAAASVDTNTPARTLSFAWTQVSGPLVSLQSNGASATFVAPAAAATLVFQVAVGNGAQTATAQVSVTVTGSTPAPAPRLQVAAPLVSADGLAAVSVSAIAIDTGTPAQPLTLRWTQVSGPAVVLASPGAASTTFVAPPGPASLEFLVTATSVRGASSSAGVRVEVVPDQVSLASAQWTARNGRLALVASSSLPSAPTQLFATIFVNGAALSTQPVPMQRRVGAACGAAPACWVLTGATPRVRAGNVNAFLPPSAVVISSNRGGSANADPGSIQVQ